MHVKFILLISFKTKGKGSRYDFQASKTAQSAGTPSYSSLPSGVFAPPDRQNKCENFNIWLLRLLFLRWAEISSMITLYRLFFVDQSCDLSCIKQRLSSPSTRHSRSGLPRIFPILHLVTEETYSFEEKFFGKSVLDGTHRVSSPLLWQWCDVLA